MEGRIGPRRTEAPWWRVVLVGRRPRRTLLRALAVAAVAFVFFRFVLLPVRVVGASMEPTVPDGAWRFAFLPRYAFSEPRRGDIVVIALAGRRVMYLKRVLAVPGDRLRFEAGRLYLDGEPQPEPYVRQRGRWTTSAYKLAPGEYYVAGDNRRAPIEEHATGIVDRRRIAGGLAW